MALLSTSYGLEGQRKQISSASAVSAAVGHCYKIDSVNVLLCSSFSEDCKQTREGSLS